MAYGKKISIALLAAASLSGCAAGIRVAHFGPLPNRAPLVTLIVSEDLEIVRDECQNHGDRTLGCHIARVVEGAEGELVQTVKIVRYADALPSALTFEIDAHELCHAVAALQGLVDPCHASNDGVIQAARAEQRAIWSR